MSVQMIGIDHSLADVVLREVFAFTKGKSADAMQEINKIHGVLGCVVLSTCNRTEVWLSSREDILETVYQELCRIKAIGCEEYRDYFVTRTGDKAVSHLLRLACGLKSKILGEDQILTQVKDALAWSRANYCTDNILEVLFRTAVTAAKKVKTQINFSVQNESVILQAIKTLKQKNMDFRTKHCLVIGNGNMGKSAAVALKAEGADVTVTVREYKSGVVEIPPGCKRINYGNRFDQIKAYDMIVSATSSPNTTVKLSELEKITLTRPLLLIDLAVPRDIDPRVKNLPNITLYDIDDFETAPANLKTRKLIEKSELILNEQIRTFYDWYESRDVIPVIENLGESAANNVLLRLKRPLRPYVTDEGCKEEVDRLIQEAVKKEIKSLLFTLRDTEESGIFLKDREGKGGIS